MPATINVLFLAAEAEPFAKVGGLADVAGSLPFALRALPYQAAGGKAIDVRLVLPLHRVIRSEAATLRPAAEFTLYRRGGSIPTQIFEMSYRGMPVYFVSGDPILTAPSVYSPDPTRDREKFTFFSLAVLEMIRYLDWQPDILHGNDWHTALALYALRSRRADAVFGRMATVLTIHNLPYMGGDAATVLNTYGLMPPSEPALPPWALTQPLPLGIWAADAIIPVSPTYAREILTPDFGCGLDGYLRSRAESITGILNGLDLTAWDPENDQALAERFGVETLSRRSANKIALQKRLGLKEDDRIPLLAMIGRVDQQKGVDIALETLRRSSGQPWQFVLLGTGDPGLEAQAQALQSDFSDRVRVELRFDPALSRLLYGGADLLLMPSRYEPCGLAQMIAMRYGCVPLVRATGGLKDTVRDGKTGFLFTEPSADSMQEALKRALSVYAMPERWKHFQRSGMLEDFSWARSAQQYATIYRSLLR